MVFIEGTVQGEKKRGRKLKLVDDIKKGVYKNKRRKRHGALTVGDNNGI